LLFSSNAATTPTVLLPVTIDAGGFIPPDPVGDLTIIADGANLHLRWSASANTNSYEIWRGTTWPPDELNSSSIGTTTATEFVTAPQSDGVEFYFVKSLP
jgi:hypothetical protein